MSTARVDDIEVLKMFRATLFKFGEAAGIALGDAESEIHRTMNWLENEQRQKWENEHRRRLRVLAEAKEKLRMKKVFSGPAGTKQSVVDEEKAVKVATVKVAEAEQKMQAIKSWGRRLQKEMLLYKGQTQRFTTVTSVDIPMAAAVLGNMVVRLEAYASLAPSSATSAAGSESGGSMVNADGTNAAGEGPSLVELLQKLRAGTPGQADRAGAAVEPIDLTKGSAERISDDDRATIRSLCAADAAPLAEGATMVASTAVIGKTRIYLQRLNPVKDGDSGWYLAPAEVGANPFNVTLPVTDALQARPDWAELLMLPIGSLVVVDGGAVAAVITTDGVDRWGEAAMAKLEEVIEAPVGEIAEKAEVSVDDAKPQAAPAAGVV